jgi:tetratricopeptide (TPR) repeat protein
VIVATVATNLEDCAPFASLHREGLSADDSRSWSGLVQQGSRAEDNRAFAEALAAYSSALKIDDQYAELEFRIARCLWQLGDYTRAHEHFSRARDLDTLRFRADSRINEINRAAGGSPGVELVDVERMLSKASPNNLIGSEFVYEHVHLTPRANYLIAAAMFHQIESRFPAAQAQGAAGIASQAEIEQRLALTEHDRVRMTREMLGRLQKPPFTSQLNHADQVLRLAIQVGAPDQNPDQTAGEYQWAIQQRPDDRVLHYNFGLFLYDYDRNAAAEQLRLSRPWDGFPVFTPDGTPLE